MGNGFGDRFNLRISLIFVLIGVSGLYIEIINAFEYLQGARKWFSNFICLSFMIRVDVKPMARLTLIASDPRISGALMILSVTKMILIYLNYRIWFIKLKIIHENVLNTLVFDGDGKQLESCFQTYSL